jgi:hypothetical protein
MARAGDAFSLVLLEEVIVTPSVEIWEGRGVYGDGDGDGGRRGSTQAGV